MITKVSIIIPALNEEQAIMKTIETIPKNELETIGYAVQILVVDNGSEDRTSTLAREAGAEVHEEGIRGYGRAYKKGFMKATGDIIATCDADLSYPIREILAMIQLLENDNLDFITTNRFASMDKDAMSLRNRIGNKILSFILRLLFKVDIKDSQSGMWVFRKRLLNNLVLRSDGMSLSEEIKIEACYYNTCRWIELPIAYRARVGTVKLRPWRDGILNLLFLVKKRIKR